MSKPIAYLYELRGVKSYSTTPLLSAIALGWHETPLYAESGDASEIAFLRKQLSLAKEMIDELKNTAQPSPSVAVNDGGTTTSSTSLIPVSHSAVEGAPRPGDECGAEPRRKPTSRGGQK